MKTKAFILKSRFIFLDMYNGIIKKKKKKEFAFGQSAACTQSHVEFPLRHSQYKHPTKKQDASKRGSKTKKRVDKKKNKTDNTVNLGRITDKGNSLSRRFLEENKQMFGTSME